MSIDRQDFAYVTQQAQGGNLPSFWPIVINTTNIALQQEIEINITPCDAIWMPAVYDLSIQKHPVQPPAALPAGWVPPVYVPDPINPPALGPNLIVNGSFEDGFTNWLTSGAVLDATQFHSGANSAKLNAGYCSVQPALTLSPGNLYSLSFWYKTDGPQNGPNITFANGADIQFQNVTGATIDYEPPYVYLRAPSSNIPQGWTQISAQFTVLAALSNYNATLGDNPVGNTSTWLDDVFVGVVADTGTSIPQVGCNPVDVYIDGVLVQSAPVFSIRVNTPNNPWILFGLSTQLGTAYASTTAPNLVAGMGGCMRSLTGPISRLWVKFYKFGTWQSVPAGAARAGIINEGQSSIVLMSSLGFAQQTIEYGRTWDETASGVYQTLAWSQSLSSGGYETPQLNTAARKALGMTR